MWARSSWAATPPRWLATTSPDPITSCRPQARRASPRRSARRISSSARASSSTRRVASPPPRRISGCSRGSKGSPDTGAPPSYGLGATQGGPYERGDDGTAGARGTQDQGDRGLASAQPRRHRRVEGADADPVLQPHARGLGEARPYG